MDLYSHSTCVPEAEEETGKVHSQSIDTGIEEEDWQE